jgi:hypothetical protein
MDGVFSRDSHKICKRKEYHERKFNAHGLKTALVRKRFEAAGATAGGETTDDSDDEDGFSASLEIGRGLLAGEPLRTSWLRVRHSSLRSASDSRSEESLGGASPPICVMVFSTSARRAYTSLSA